jgi:hypothetical protein
VKTTARSTGKATPAKAEPAKSAAKATAEPAKPEPAKTETAKAEPAKTEPARTEAKAGPAESKGESKAETKAESKAETKGEAKGGDEPAATPVTPATTTPTAPVEPVWVAPAPSADADRDSGPVGYPSAGTTPSTVESFGSPMTVPSGLAGEALSDGNGSSNGSEPGREVLVGEIVAGDAITSRPTNGSSGPDEERDTPTLP